MEAEAMTREYMPPEAEEMSSGAEAKARFLAANQYIEDGYWAGQLMLKVMELYLVDPTPIEQQFIRDAGILAQVGEQLHPGGSPEDTAFVLSLNAAIEKRREWRGMPPEGGYHVPLAGVIANWQPKPAYFGWTYGDTVIVKAAAVPPVPIASTEARISVDHGRDEGSVRSTYEGGAIVKEEFMPPVNQSGLSGARGSAIPAGAPLVQGLGVQRSVVGSQPSTLDSSAESASARQREQRTEETVRELRRILTLADIHLQALQKSLASRTEQTPPPSTPSK
jgi:hypothetical protein